MAALRELYTRLDENDEVDNAQVIFITVDPERDTPPVLKEYTGYFHDDFIGLTGDKSAIDQLTGMIGIAYGHGKKDARGDYLVDHSASIFLISPEREWIGLFSAPHQVDEIYQRYLRIKTFLDQQG